MIQIYKPDNTDYEHNGDMVLFPEEATIHVVLNGEWTATLTHPIDPEGRWRYIIDNAVVKMPSFNGEQLFRLKNKEKSDAGVSAELTPVFLDAKDDCFLVDVRPTGKTGQEALDIMTEANKKYCATSDITKTSTAYYQTKNLIEAINGEDDNSFVNRWGGEIIYDNYNAIINKRAGGDYGVQVLYGKNIVEDGFAESVDMSEVATRIVPKAYNGYMLSGAEPWIDSPLIEKYPTIHNKVIKFDDVKMKEDARDGDEEEGITICETQEELDAALTQKCKEQFEAGIDKPTVTISANMELLQNAELYEDVKELEKVSLGDTVHCRHSKLDITSDARIIELEYDAVKDRISTVTIGEFQYNFLNAATSSFNRVDQTVRQDGTLIGQQIQGIIDAAKAQLRAQSTASKKQDVRAILFEDLDKSSPLYGAMSLGTQGIEISKKRTADGRDWEWTTTVTAAGIMAGTIVAGILSDQTGKNYWDLDRGIVNMDVNSFTLSGSTVNEIAKNEAEDVVQTSQNIVMYLTSEFEAIPTDASGNASTISAATTVSVYFAKKNVTKDATYNITLGDGVSGSWDADTATYTITGLTKDTGYVDIQATYTYNGETMYTTKRFAVSKLKQGKVGDVYMIDCVDAVIWDDNEKSYMPKNPRANVKVLGHSNKVTGFWDWKIEFSADGTTWNTVKSVKRQQYIEIPTTIGAYPTAEKNNRTTARITLYQYNTGVILAQKQIQFLTQLQTQQDIFNMLTNYGKAQGIFLKDGKLYMNAEYLATGILAAAKGRSYWNLNTGDMLVTGQFAHYNEDRGVRSVEIANNQAKFYDWTTDGNYVGSIGAVKDRNQDKVGISMWCDSEDKLTIGYWGPVEGEEDGIHPMIAIDGEDQGSVMPWIKDGASGTIFPDNKSGGIKIENGFVKDWNLSWWSGKLKTADGLTLVVKNGMIQECL